MNKSDEKQAGLSEAIQQNAGAPLEQIAQENQVSTLEVVRCLPDAEAVITGSEAFNTIMDHMSSWGKITFITNANDVVLEAKGEIPKGSIAHGYFNMNGPAFGGHIKYDHCLAICFVSRQLFGKDSHSVQFYNRDGDCMFKVYLGRDANRQLLPDQVDKYLELRSRYTG